LCTFLLSTYQALSTVCKSYHQLAKFPILKHHQERIPLIDLDVFELFHEIHGILAYATFFGAPKLELTRNHYLLLSLLLLCTDAFGANVVQAEVAE
jgi:hypothetical protein